MRASDADREATVDALKRHSAAGRIDSDELAERSGRAYAAATVAELAELSADLPASPRAAPATYRSRGRPGLAPFSVMLDVDRPRDEVIGALLRRLVPALQDYGYELTEQTETRLQLKLEERAMSNIVLGFLLFPVGGFLLWLDKRRSQVSVALEEPAPGHTRLTAYGNASLAVRRRFERLVL